MSTILLFLKALPVVLEIIRLIQRHRLSAEATEEVLADLKANGERFVLRAQKAREGVSDDPADIESDPNNRP